MLFLLLCSLPLLSSTDDAVPEYGPQFGQHWFDGKAEVAFYDLQRERYGEAREGRIVAVTVTEPFSVPRRVKAERPGGEVVGVLKLNLMQDFRTGVYDYHTMTSAFVATEPWSLGEPGDPVKVAFSSQEWCGTMFHSLNFHGDTVHSQQRSYFDGEASKDEELPRAEGTMSEDTLLLWARGLAGPTVATGEETRGPVLISLERARLNHRPLQTQDAVLARGSETKMLQVPAGQFEVREATVRIGEGGAQRRWTFQVESAFPHRVVAFQRANELDAVLTGVERMPYWSLTARSDEARRAPLEGEVVGPESEAGGGR